LRQAQTELQEKTRDIPEMAKALNEERNRAQTLQKYLEVTLEQYQQSQQTAKAMEEKMALLTNQLLQKEDLLNQHQQNSSQIETKLQSISLENQKLSAENGALQQKTDELQTQKEAADEVERQNAILRNDLEALKQSQLKVQPDTAKPSKPGLATDLPTKESRTKMTLKNGDLYEGDVVNGQRTGKGKYVSKNGSVYVGDFVNGVRTGKGKLTLSNGTVYEGDFVNGKANGFGKLTQNTGEVQLGRFVDGKYVGN